MGKLGEEFELGNAETELLKTVRSVRGVRFVALCWSGDRKQHMMWEARCNDPKAARNSIGSLRIVYEATPRKALLKLADEMGLKNVL